MGSGVEVRWIKHTVQTKPLCLQEKFCSTVGYSVQVLIGLQNKAMQQMVHADIHEMSTLWVIILLWLNEIQSTDKKSPMELINEVPPITVDARVVACEGGTLSSPSLESDVAIYRKIINHFFVWWFA